MSLSEHERHVLAQLEERLYEHDPDFAHRVRLKTALLDDRHRHALALSSSALAVVVGLGLMLVFCLTTSVKVGVLGFLVTFLGLDISWTNVRRMVAARRDVRAGSQDTGDAQTGSRLRHWFPRYD